MYGDYGDTKTKCRIGSGLGPGPEWTSVRQLEKAK